MRHNWLLRRYLYNGNNEPKYLKMIIILPTVIIFPWNIRFHSCILHRMGRLSILEEKSRVVPFIRIYRSQLLNRVVITILSGHWNHCKNGSERSMNYGGELKGTDVCCITKPISLKPKRYAKSYKITWLFCVAIYISRAKWSNRWVKERNFLKVRWILMTWMAVNLVKPKKLLVLD